MAKTRKKPAKKTAEKKDFYYIKVTHKKHLTKLVKQLHALGVDVTQHAKMIGIDEEKLEKIEKEETTHISASDAGKLDLILHNIMSASENIVKLEMNIYRYTQPLVEIAYAKAAPIQEKMFRIESLPHLFKGKRNSETGVKDAHKSLLASYYYENILYESLPIAIKRIEHSITELVKLEKKWKQKGGQARLEMLRVHKTIRDILHEDMHNISNEIFKMYNLRMKTFKHLITLDEKNEKRKFPDLDKQYYKTAVVQGHYVKIFREHKQKMIKIYGEI